MDRPIGLEEEQTDYKDASHVPEMALIGSVLRDGKQFVNLHGALTAEDFHWKCYGWAWKIFVKLHEQGLSIDTIMVRDELEREGLLSQFILDGGESAVNFIGFPALSRLRDFGEKGMAESYARAVLDYSAKRQQLEIFNMGASWAINGRSADAIKNDIAVRLEAVQTWNGQVSKHTQTLAKALSDAYDRVDRASKGEIVCTPTGLVDLDRLLSGGLYAPDLLLIAGRPGQGKTAFLTTVIKNAAQQGKRVVHFGLEMANRQTAERMIAMESGVPTDRQRSGKLRDEEWPMYTHAFESLENLPVLLNDMPAIRPSQMRYILRKQEGVDLVTVDYIQLQEADEKHRNRYEDIDSIAYGLKAIAKEFDVPILAAAQLSRAVDQRQSKKPILSDLRESGGLEQASDIVMFIYRPDELDKQNINEVIVAKHRNGPTGSVELIYRPTLTKFENAVTRHIAFNEPRDYTV